MAKLFWIFLGSGIGGVLRYALSGAWQRATDSSFPIGTFFVNVTGCLLIGFLSAALAGRLLLREELRVALLVGFLGGYTTFSSFGLETFRLANDRQFVAALVNVCTSVLVGVTAVWIGYRLAESWLGA